MVIYPEIIRDGLKIVFLHIPKTAGKTFRKIIEQQFEKCNEANLSNLSAIMQYAKSTPEERAALDLIFGHFAYYSFAGDIIPRRFRFFTLLRDPVERVISLYDYWKNDDNGLRVRACREFRKHNMSFEDFMNDKYNSHATWIFAYMTQFSDMNKFREATKENLKRQVEIAISNLLTNFEFIGLTEQFDRGLEYLKKVYGFDIGYEKINVTPEWAKNDVTEDQKKRLKKYLEPEYIIYNTGVKVFEERMKRHGL